MNWLQSLSFGPFMMVLAIANLAMYAAAWLVVEAVQALGRDRLLNTAKVRVEFSDYALSLLIVTLNTALAIPGWLLWQRGWITLEHGGFGEMAMDLVLMLLYFDLAMYCGHRLMHWGPLYRHVHGRHHEHVDVNGISLFVMHPLEALGFGFLLLLFLLVHATNFYTLLLFLTINWLYGTMAHSGIRIQAGWLLWLVGDTEFHHHHHARQQGNFGFFTSVWDGLFGTRIH